ncbi:aldo/keto reductase [Vreelandella glaciei]|uniref:aldo/keto reductase n=1 Tax=Vreelandella glaciei TaxID=186761 RepID=UPI0030EEC6AB|tara:strand:- start:766 stop:1632 length:867 start_codon:yes stop_codon:yes gene_type:complete
MKHRITRRQSLTLIGATLAAVTLPTASLLANKDGMRQKAFADTDKTLPVIGMGTWRTFNVGSDPQLLDARTEVVKAFFEHGGGLIDSSPMYGSAPDVMGYALEQLGTPESLFAAEKVWSPAGGSAREQVAELKDRWKVEHFDLVQVHNLTDWREHLSALQEMKAEGIIRHVGITTSHGRRHREAENRLLPLAEEQGIGVIANRPYDGGSLIKHLKRRNAPLPEWAQAECGCITWADFLLKFIVSHPAITCAIPATTQVEHLRENMRAGHSPMPSTEARQRMAAYIESL